MNADITLIMVPTVCTIIFNQRKAIENAPANIIGRGDSIRLHCAAGMSPPASKSREEDQPFTIYMYSMGQKVTGNFLTYLNN